MRGYEERIAHGGTVSAAYEEWAAEREQELLRICRSRTATVDEVRAAQAQLEEVDRVARLRERCRISIEGSQ